MRDSLGNKLSNDYAYVVGDRVELHPATDAWARGDRYGQIVRRGTKFYHVAMDRSQRVLRVPPRNICQRISCKEG